MLLKNLVLYTICNNIKNDVKTIEFIKKHTGIDITLLDIMKSSLKDSILPLNNKTLYGSCVPNGLYILSSNKNKFDVEGCTMCTPCFIKYLNKYIYIGCNEDVKDKYKDIYLNIDYTRNIYIKKFNIEHFISYLDTCFKKSYIIFRLTYYLNLYMEDYMIDIIEFDKNSFENFFNNRSFIGKLLIKIKYRNIFMSSSILIHNEFLPIHLYRNPLSPLSRDLYLFL